MRLFGQVDGAVDRRDRAGWLTPPFDLAFRMPGGEMVDFTLYVDRARDFTASICRTPDVTLYVDRARDFAVER